MTRRELLLATAAAPLLSAPATAVPPVDVTKLKPADFTDADLDLPYALVHFARVANSVKMDGPDRGFIGLSVWRTAKDNRPYNARGIVERLPVFDAACVASASPVAVRAQQVSPVPGKTFSVVELRGTGKLEYEIRPPA
jgi:hypothetical protein